MNKEYAIRKINSIGKNGRTISTILQVILVMGVALASIGIIIFLAFPKNILTLTLDGTATVSLDENAIREIDPTFTADDPEALGSVAGGSLNINSNEYTQGAVTIENGKINICFMQKPAVVTSVRLLMITLAIIAYMAISFALIIFVKKLCKSLETCSSPFEENIIKELQHCVWFSIPWIIVGGIAQNILMTALSNTVNFTISFSLTTVLIFLLLFALAYIFKYGAVLQQESDETL